MPRQPAGELRLGRRRKGAGLLGHGFDADLLAVAGNPLDGLEALLDVRAVIRMGHFVPAGQRDT